DGVFGGIADDALGKALALQAKDVDVHAIVLDPGRMHSPGATALHLPVSMLGGTYVEVGTGELDDALAGIGSWLRPAWLALAMPGIALPDQLRAGTGVVEVSMIRRARKLALTGHADAAFATTARAAPAAPI